MNGAHSIRDERPPPSERAEPSDSVFSRPPDAQTPDRAGQEGEVTATPRLGPLEIAATVAVVVAENLIAWTLFGRQALADVAMVFLLGVVVVAMRFSFYAATLAAAASVLSYDFFFIPPYFSFTVYEGRHLVTFAVMFFVAMVISSLAQRIREQANAARLRDQRAARIAAEAEAARIEVETERLRSSLLSSVSHDLRTPLAVITGAATTLLSESATVDPAMQRDLLSAIYDESVRLSRLVVNLLDMTRLSAGALKVNKEWQSIEAVVGAAIGRVEDRLGGRPLHLHVPASLPLVPFDAVLVEQVLINLLENAAKYSPASAPIEVSASVDAVTAGAVPPDSPAEGPREIVIQVADRGPGVPEAAQSRIFEKFYRLPGAPAGGAGLGLAICRGIVEAHGGRIGVVDRESGGSRFRFTLPIEGSPPAVEEDGGAT